MSLRAAKKDGVQPENKSRLSSPKPVKKDAVQSEQPDNTKPSPQTSKELAGQSTRCRQAFFLLGLCNNFSYAIVMTAAVDIMRGEASDTTGSTFTAYIYVANIVPSLFAKVFGPFFYDRVSYTSRTLLAIVTNFVALQLVSSNLPLFSKLAGIGLSSFGHGVGEGSLLALSSQYHPTIITALSTGFAGAGLSSAVGYLVLTSILELPPLGVLFGVSFVSLGVHVFAYFVLLEAPTKKDDDSKVGAAASSARLSMQEKMGAINQIRKHLCTLFVEYTAHYLVMSGTLSSLTDFSHNPYPTARDTFVRFMFLERVGNICSRYFPDAIKVTNPQLLAFMQIINFLLLAGHAYSPFLHSVYVAFALVLWMGLVTGTCYVHAFSTIRKSIASSSHTEFCMGIASTANECGITFASLVAIHLQNFLQQAPSP